MQFYTTQNPQTLPNWAIVVSNIAGLTEVEINDRHPGFQALLDKLVTEIQPGILGVKAADLCAQLSAEMSNEELVHEDYNRINLLQPKIQSWSV